MTQLPNTLGKFVWHYLKPHKWCLVAFVLVAVVWSIDMSVSPYLLKVIINTVSQYAGDKSKAVSLIILPAVLYIVMSIIFHINFRLYDYTSLKLYPAIKSQVTKDMFSYTLNHSFNYFQNTFSGSITKKILDMAHNMEQLITIPNEWVYPRIIAFFVAAATLSISVKPIFGIILFIWSILFVMISFFATRKSELLARKNSENFSVLSGTLNDCFTNIMSVKLFNSKKDEFSHITNDLNDLVKSDRAALWYNLKFNVVQAIGSILLLAAMLFTLVFEFKNGAVNAGDFALVLTLSISFMWSLYNIGTQMQNFTKAAGICNQALSLIQVKHDIVDSLDATPLAVSKGELRFLHVNFRYNNNDSLFSDLSLIIPPSQKVGLVGFSGGGKSSFVKLILRLMDIQSGKILIDHQDISKVTQDSLRSQISTIPQDPDLFHRTIMENIRFAKPGATDDEVIQASKHAQCHEFIEQLPDQYQSLVGERGVKLSGGQKQRIAIARAFLKNAPILLLDEATSSLDSVTEKHIHEALHAVMRNKTTIVIAHRLSTLKDMDRILVFDKGAIVEDGSLDELLKNKSGHFYKLWEMQASGFIPS